MRDPILDESNEGLDLVGMFATTGKNLVINRPLRSKSRTGILSVMALVARITP
jgi:hypothetical protein